MVQEFNMQPIPEELYNLTQLAEVTLAAGRLSTTNVNAITEYINNEKHKYLDNNDTKEDNNECFDRKKLKYRKKLTTTSTVAATAVASASTLPVGSVVKTDEWFENSDNFKSIQKVPIADNIGYHSNSINVMKNVVKNCNEFDNNSNSDNINDRNYEDEVKNIDFNQTLLRNRGSFSSSDDDSNYYSHKIFDRKKCRRSTIQSDNNLRYDEHSCSSMPSSNGEENFSNLNHSSTKQLPSSSLSSLSSASLSSSSSSSGNNTSLSLDTDDHICPECGKKYSTSSNLARHRQTHRSILDKKARRCPHCEKVYVSMPAYSMHVRTHSQGCECPHCGKCFSRPWLLQGHIRTHTGEKPFKCSICTKAFADKSNLRAHIQTHSNTKPHSCGRCGKAFALKSYLYKHEESSCMRNHSKPDKHDKQDRSANKKSDSTKISVNSKIMKKDTTFLKDSNQQYPDVIVTQDTVNHEEKSEKSYTTLTSSMSQDDFDRFTRISVIRPPLTNQNLIEPTNNFEMNFYQENPVDFSPKNNFSHSTKTNPFELTSNYTLVA